MEVLESQDDPVAKFRPETTSLGPILSLRLRSWLTTVPGDAKEKLQNELAQSSLTEALALNPRGRTDKT
jgi:hypothetical protein